MRNQVTVGVILFLIGFYNTILGPFIGLPIFFFLSYYMTIVVNSILLLGGLALMVWGIRLDRRREFFPTKDGLQGIVKSLTIENSVANFWLAAQEKYGENVPVEAFVGDRMVREGETVWVQGKRGGDGIFRASQIRSLSEVAPAAVDRSSMYQREMKREGEMDFTGTITGQGYPLFAKSRFGRYKNKFGFKIQRYDKDGNPFPSVTEIVFGEEDVNIFALGSGDRVWVSGKWDKSGRFLVEEARNISSNAIVKSRKRKLGWVKKVLAGIIALFILYVLFRILFSP